MQKLEKGDIIYAIPHRNNSYANVVPFEITRVTPTRAYGTHYSAAVQIQRTATRGDTFAAVGLSRAEYKLLTPEIQAQIKSDKEKHDIYLWFSDFVKTATQAQKEQVFNLFNP